MLKDIEGTLDYVSLDLEIMHDGCTSIITSEYDDVVVSLLHCQSFKDRGYSWVVTEARARHPSHLEKYARSLKKHNKIRSIIESRWNSSNTSLRLSMIEGYEGTVSSLAYEFGALHKMEVASNGCENWKIILPLINHNRFLDIIRYYGEVKMHRSMRFDFNSNYDVIATLSSREKQVFKVAYQLGYFEYPKKAHLKDVAEKTNLSIPTINEYIRASQKKLLRYFADAIVDS